ncbi:uncharacterized protein I206_104341 [Kwoniella pini CBS 10737]|uniref:Alpha-ketoglutarate-dependent dioxygenase AlkB-like domain-containing protein n=1 Tax=Kwoniella pini CBS 10737 TaxID=1296096 RepID=A0A1B9I1Z7_9TREE|nr:uncharacterized protein I206_04081 [Kwoniella pini CBS 10737]OCF49559.1 hypothetical protein I206_04081 [Kwoniella pini CBS 10737]
MAPKKRSAELSSASLSPAPPNIKRLKNDGLESKSRSQTKSKISKYDPTDEFQQITLPSFVNQWRVQDMGYGGDVYYQPEFIQPAEAQRWYDELLNLDTYQPMLKLYGREFPQSRHIAAYSTTPNATLSYSGSTINMNYPFPPILDKIRERLERDLSVRFNHCMLNRYDDGSVYIGKHSDNLNNLVIASVSLGAERKFIMSPRVPGKSGKNAGGQTPQDIEMQLKGRKNISWKLGNGSLVIMQGRTQEFWKVSSAFEL